LSDRKNVIAAHICDILHTRAAELGFTIPKIDPEFRFFESGILDSMGFVALIAHLEDHFEVVIDFTLLPPKAFSTVGGLAATIAEMIAV